MSTPGPNEIAHAAELLGVNASCLALALPLVRAMGVNGEAPDALVRVEDAGVEKAGLRAKIREGALGVVRIGRADYVRRSDLLALVMPRVQTAPASGVALSDLAQRERAPKRKRTS